MTNLGGTGVSENTDFDDEVTELLDRQDRLNPATLAIWQDDPRAKEGDVVTTAERTAGGGGGATGNIIASGTENGLDIVKHNTLPLSFNVRSNGIVNLRKYGVTSGSDASLAMQRASDLFSTKKIILDLPVTWSTQYTLRSNLEIDGMNSGVITIDTALLTQGILGTSVSGFKIYGLTMLRDTSLPVDSGLKRHMQLNSCSDFTLDNLHMNQSHNIAVVLDGCNDFTVNEYHGKNNTAAGILVRNNCRDFNLSNMTFNRNGFLGTNPEADFGRGLVIWQCERGNIDNIVSTNNGEYDIRLYSQSDDIHDSKELTFTNITCSGDANINFFMFNESGKMSDITVAGLNITCTGTGKVACALEGDNITVTGVAFKSTTPESNIPFAFNKGDNISVSDGTVEGFINVVSYGITNIPTNCIIDNITATGMKEVAGVINGDGHEITNCKFKFAAGTTIPAIALNDLYETKVAGNRFDGAFQVISMNNSASEIINNKSVNTIDVPIRKFGSSVAGLTLHGNDWDKNSNPREIGVVDIIKRGETLNFVTGYTVVDITALTNIDWPLQTIFYSMDVGIFPGFIGSRKTVAGTPGILNGGNTTGGITTGTPDLVVSSATGLFEGAYITIAGVTGIKRVLSVDGTSVTIDSNADATVAGAAVAYSNEVWKTFGVVTP